MRQRQLRDTCTTRQHICLRSGVKPAAGALLGRARVEMHRLTFTLSRITKGPFTPDTVE